MEKMTCVLVFFLPRNEDLWQSAAVCSNNSLIIRAVHSGSTETQISFYWSLCFFTGLWTKNKLRASFLMVFQSSKKGPFLRKIDLMIFQPLNWSAESLKTNRHKHEIMCRLLLCTLLCLQELRTQWKRCHSKAWDRTAQNLVRESKGVGLRALSVKGFYDTAAVGQGQS